MTLNKQQAQYDSEQAYNEATQDEIKDVLKADGPIFCGQIASRIGKTPQETRWHLTQLDARGEVDYSWIKGYSV